MTQVPIQQVLDAAIQHHQVGRLAEAEIIYREILAQFPDHADALHLLGVLYKQKGRNQLAADLIGQAIALNLSSPIYYNNMGSVLLALGRLDEAVKAYRNALQLKPDYAQAHNNLGNALKEQGHIDSAFDCYHTALKLKPDLPEAYNNLGNAFKDLGQLEKAIATFQAVLRLKPDYSDAYSNLLYSLHYHDGYDAKAIYEELLRWNREQAEPFKKFIQPHYNDRDTERRLKIGYVSADFCAHVSAFFLDPLLRSHDQSKFEIFCYAHSVRPDSLTQQFQSYSNHWRNVVGLSDDALAEHIRRDSIDILVDLKLHTAENRLLVFARKPAPVQVSWLGYPGSTGLDTIDYRLTDPYLDPPGLNDKFYSEQSVRLPDCFWCYDPLTSEPHVNELPALQNNYVTFGCLNNFCKINNGVLGLWAKVLAAVPHSRLILLAPHDRVREHVLERLNREGIDSVRVEFIDRQPRAEYLKLYHRIDIGLDTHPYNGHTTSLDSFWMGVPVVSLAGRTAVGRGGNSILINLGMPELIAQSLQHYVQIAVKLASDLHMLREIRETLRQRMLKSPLMDAKRFTRNIELVYRDMWRKWCEQ